MIGDECTADGAWDDSVVVVDGAARTLLLRSLSGGEPRRLASFPERRRRVGHPRGPARIVVRKL